MVIIFYFDCSEKLYAIKAESSQPWYIEVKHGA